MERYKIYTSNGEVIIEIVEHRDDRVVLDENSSAILKKWFDVWDFAITDGFLFINLSDGFYGTPEYKLFPA
ncbi:MAG: hypothetical protein Q8K86_11570 [Candidatus Nanopelagicaceae bacterium]|nr:hypothetical protein [Candidatus Nanopelagicaceae bacterium]